MSVAVAGLGNMGVPIAERVLAAGHSLEAGYADLDFMALFLRLQAHANARASSLPTRRKA